ncbi:TraR/DksA C4-type zinc finger protein [Desulfotomaculum copahuensis]|uniref:Zinc finger DksA/TraR C4-type domain-containing protein n=1 Tax=Desulfotomaculum copahuensis TaxID=1838280 RepID=A0A1B7LHI5_9FIRM|nr:TraR/DksA C4-type zinc finger protein [Desulfotomaculum copahuensis]OAT85745.1 hypothetical protein A6M21_04400 [Desulfotomaculum copahuensis]
MQTAQLEDFRRRLKEEKQQQLERVKAINRDGLNTSMSDSLGELSLYDNEPADTGSELFERSKDFSLREAAKIKIRAIDEALDRIERGTYGNCEICGRPIAVERLQAVPYTTVCIHCRRDDEHEPVSSVRPIEEEVVDELYMTAFDESMDGVEYDFEDSWQDVARYSEHAGHSEAGAYYGNNELDEEDRGYVEEVENIPYEIGDDGVIYRNYRGLDDESAPRERIDTGIEHSKREADSSSY